MAGGIHASDTIKCRLPITVSSRIKHSQFFFTHYPFLCFLSFPFFHNIQISNMPSAENNEQEGTGVVSNPSMLDSGSDNSDEDSDSDSGPSNRHVNTNSNNSSSSNSNLSRDSSGSDLGSQLDSQGNFSIPSFNEFPRDFGLSMLLFICFLLRFPLLFN